MLKKEELIVLGIFLLLASLAIYSNEEGLLNITGMATDNSTDGDATESSFDVILTKTELRSGEDLQGYIDLTLAEPIDVSTTIKLEFNGISKQITLKEYLTKNNISFIESQGSVYAFNPSNVKQIIFGGASSKKLVFKIPKFATVTNFDMTVASDAENPVSFVNFDVEDITDKNEWKYFGDFVEYNSVPVYPESLNVNSEGDADLIGGATDHNKTYFCESIELPESKDFKLSAKFRKDFAGADMKAVLLTFDGEYGSGGADFCDLPEPEIATIATWYGCDLNFPTSKQGIYLICIYYEGDNEKKYYRLSKDSTISNSRYTCPITGGKTLCYPYNAKDYFIRAQIGKYTGILDKSISWANGVTDQTMEYSLTQFLSECNEDEIGDCMVPVTISSESAGNILLGDLNIEYTEEGGSAAYSSLFYEMVEVAAGINKIGGVDLANASKNIQIDLEDFNISALNITEVSKSLFLETSITSLGKITKPVTVFGAGYVPETGSIEEKLDNAKKVISDMESEHGDVLDMFGIKSDIKQLNTYEAEVNKIKLNTSLTRSEVESQLSVLSGQIDDHLNTQPKSFSVSISFKDLYIPEPGHVEDVVLENVDEYYLYQNKVEVTVEAKNYVLKKYGGGEENYVVVVKTILPKESLSNVYVYEIIPKTFASSVSDIKFENSNYEVVEEDPIVRYTFPSIGQSTSITYGVKDVDLTSNMIYSLKSIVIPEEEGAIKKTNECGNGVCEIPYEDEVVCPEDCGGKRGFPWLLIIVLVILLIAGVAYINFYKGKGEFRKVMGKSPFRNAQNLNSLKNYIRTAQDKGLKKQAIAQALLKTGWTKDKIIYAFEDLKWAEKRLFTIKLAPSGDQNVKKLHTFIKKCLELNIPEAKINQILIDKGWDFQKIDAAFVKIGKPKEKVVTEKEKKKKVALYFEKALESVKKK